MANTMKRVVRDRLVNDAAIRGFFPSVTTTSTASLFVTPTFMEVTGSYPRIVYSEIYGKTDPGMSATNGLITFAVATKNLSGINPHVTTENIMERINQLFDDQVITGVGISGTAAYCFLMLRDGGSEMTYDPERKDYMKFVTYSYKVADY